MSAALEPDACFHMEAQGSIGVPETGKTHLFKDLYIETAKNKEP